VIWQKIKKEERGDSGGPRFRNGEPGKCENVAKLPPCVGTLRRGAEGKMGWKRRELNAKLASKLQNEFGRDQKGVQK